MAYASQVRIQKDGCRIESEWREGCCKFLAQTKLQGLIRGGEGQSMLAPHELTSRFNGSVVTWAVRLNRPRAIHPHEAVRLASHELLHTVTSRTGFLSDFVYANNEFQRTSRSRGISALPIPLPTADSQGSASRSLSQVHLADEGAWMWSPDTFLANALSQRLDLQRRRQEQAAAARPSVRPLAFYSPPLTFDTPTPLPLSINDSRRRHRSLPPVSSAYVGLWEDSR